MRWKKRAQDRGRLESYQQDAEHQARRILRELGRTIDLDEAETLRLRVDEPPIIRGLGQRFAQLRGQAEEARKTIARHEDQIKRQEKERADLEQPPDVEPLRRAVSQARKAGDLDARLAETRGKLASAEKKAKTALAQLPGLEPLGRRTGAPGRPLERHPGSVRIPAPGNDEAATVRSTERMAAEDDSIRQTRVAVAVTGARARRAHRRSASGRAQRRDHGWQLVKAAWLENRPPGEDIAAFPG